MKQQDFVLGVGDESIVGDTLAAPSALQALFLHGAGQSNRRRQQLLREELAQAGFGSAAFDYSGHGDSSAHSPASLQKRLQQAQAVRAHVDPGQHIHTVVGTSMSGEIAIRLACAPASKISHLVLIVGAIYARTAYTLPFGPAFSAAIRQPNSWRSAETLELIAQYRGGLTLIRALDDAVIPHEIATLLAEAAQAASFQRIIDLPHTDHRVSEKMAQDSLLRRQIAAAIRQTDQSKK